MAPNVAEVTPVSGIAPYSDIDMLLPPALEPATVADALTLMRFPTTYSPAEILVLPAVPEVRPIE